eukprot:261298_1
MKSQKMQQHLNKKKEDVILNNNLIQEKSKQKKPIKNEQNEDDDISRGSGGEMYGNKKILILSNINSECFDEEDMIKDWLRPYIALGSGGGCYCHDTGIKSDKKFSIRGGAG